MYRLHLIWILAASLTAAGGEAFSGRARADHQPDADPQSQWWRGAPLVGFEHGRNGEPVPGYRTEVRSRWTEQNLYFLFTCPYEQLYLKPGEPGAGETNKLWEWDVAEVFIGSNFENIRQYREFEVSPRGEWIDLDIELDPGGKHRIDWQWNSGFQVKTRIDEGRRVWYVEMRIPFASLAPWKPQAGRAFRANFYRIQGNNPRRFLAWQPVHQGWFHKPEAFGRLVLK